MGVVSIRRVVLFLRRVVCSALFNRCVPVLIALKDTQVLAVYYRSKHRDRRILRCAAEAYLRHTVTAIKLSSAIVSHGETTALDGILTRPNAVGAARARALGIVFYFVITRVVSHLLGCVLLPLRPLLHGPISSILSQEMVFENRSILAIEKAEQVALRNGRRSAVLSC